MIEFRPLKFSSMLHLTDVLNNLNITLFDFSSIDHETIHSFVVIDGSEIIGVCLYSFFTSDTALIKLMFMKPSERNLKLGDGLFRATLNSIEIHGGRRVIFEGNIVEHSFYLHEGMHQLTDLIELEESLELHELNMLEGRYYAYCRSISDFFSKPCRGRK